MNHISDIKVTELSRQGAVELPIRGELRQTDTLACLVLTISKDDFYTYNE